MAASMVDVEIGTVLRLLPERLRGGAVVDLAGVESVILQGHGYGAIPWSLVETPDGQRVRALNQDLEDAILA